MERKTVTAWALSVDWSDGSTTQEADMPKDVLQAVDDWLSELEQERNDDKEMKEEVGAG